MQKISAFSNQLFIIFGLFGVLFIPFTFQYLPFQTKITQFLFEDLLLILAAPFEDIYIANPEISSDSTTLYLLLVVLFCAALILVVALSFTSFWKKHQRKILLTIRIVVTYYLSLILLKYGFDKVFKAQFYLPEPNTLYTPMGMLDKDILFWSTMGVSRSYNIFMGCIEIIPALLLLYSRTRILGLFIVFAVLLNVVFINFSFDISVKVFSLFLLFLTIMLLIPFTTRIIRFFMHQQATLMVRIAGAKIIATKSLRWSVKSLVILFFALEVVMPYLNSGYFNDDKVPRNYLHGAYEVTNISSLNKELSLPAIKRLFIHRQNYFIMQYADDTMEDFKLKINQNEQEFILTTYDLKTIHFDYVYTNDKSELVLTSQELGWKITTEALPWKNLPVLQPLFHWTVDGV